MPEFSRRLRTTALLWICAIVYTTAIIGTLWGWLSKEHWAPVVTPDSLMILVVVLVGLLVLHSVSKEKLLVAYLVVAGILVGMGLMAGVALALLWGAAGPVLRAGIDEWRAHNQALQATP